VDADILTAVRHLSRDPNIDCILALLLPYSPGISADIGAKLSQVARNEGNPLIAYVPKEDKYKIISEGFELNRIPVASSVEGVSPQILHKTEHQAVVTGVRDPDTLAAQMTRLLSLNGCGQVLVEEMVSGIEVLVDFSRLIMDLEFFFESIDLNPVICDADRCVAADARIILLSEISENHRPS
jgi:acyl-CoA synthetase (NDP forming)